MMEQMDARQRQQVQQEDEIDFRGLFKKIWAVRVPVAVAVLIVTLGYWGLWGLKQIALPSSITYSRIVQFTFKGADQEQYPNGAPFRIADVVAPGILSLAYEVNGLDSHNVPEAAFVQSFAIQSYAPDYNLIIEKYEGAMGRRGITGEEIAELQARMKAELAQASARSARLSFTPAKGVHLRENQIDKILLDVPRLWAEKAIESDGVTNLDMSIYSSRIFSAQRFEALDYMIGLDLVQDNIRLIKGNIAELIELPNGRVIADDQTGYRLPDLEKDIDDIVDYDLQQLSTPIQDLGIAKNSDIVELYYRYKIRDLERDRSYALAQASLVRDTLDNYSRGDVRPDRNANSDLPNRSGLGQTTPQFSDDFIDRVIDLTQQGSDLEYRQKLTDQILEYKKEAAEVEYEIARIKGVLEAIADSGNANINELKEHYLALLEKSFPEILSRLQGYTDVIGRIYRKLSKENLGYSGMLYKIGGADELTVAGSWVGRRDLLIYGVLLFIALFGTLAVAMIIRSVRAEDRA